MNIGFYGKGGSGKTTVSALFALYLDSIDMTVGLLDVDVNSHTAAILGAEVDNQKVLSTKENQVAIWKYLAGTNERVKANEFLNTTPPGNGSNYWSMKKDNFLTKKFGQSFGKNAHIFTAGSYKPDSIGINCHHSTQTVAENMISHVQFSDNDALVVDSVAGNDAFGTTLYLNDLLVLVVKPEREALSVMHRFIEIAKHAGVADRIVIIGNQVSSDVQRRFLEREIPADMLIGILDSNEQIVEQRLEDKPLTTECIRENDKAIFDAVIKRSQLSKNAASNHESLVELHKKVASESWVAGSFREGLVDQIDPRYHTA